ncbi:hypothetical protein QQ045_011452 [Rhodiola kirilowii]
MKHEVPDQTFTKMCNLRYSYKVFTIVLTIFSEIRLAATVPAIFVFGDSLIDAGNNNYIKTLSKANYKPNGIDFGRATGRFTNGRTFIDVLGQKIGVNGFIPPFMAPTTKGTVILKGVNYASGSAGILKHTGMLFRLYALDARKFVVANVPPIGCIPYMRDTNPRFTNADSGCCHRAGRHGGLIPCSPLSHVCPDRSKYVFWDPYHPTDAANVIIANRLLDGSAPDVTRDTSRIGYVTVKVPDEGDDEGYCEDIQSVRRSGGPRIFSGLEAIVLDVFTYD